MLLQDNVSCYTRYMKLNQLIFTIAAIIVGVWILGMLFKLAAWLINGLIYVAAIIVIIGIVTTYIKRHKNKR